MRQRTETAPLLDLQQPEDVRISRFRTFERRLLRLRPAFLRLSLT
jgi:hypothetical protein